MEGARLSSRTKLGNIKIDWAFTVEGRGQMEALIEISGKGRELEESRGLDGLTI